MLHLSRFWLSGGGNIALFRTIQWLALSPRLGQNTPSTELFSQKNHVLLSNFFSSSNMLSIRLFLANTWKKNRGLPGLFPHKLPWNVVMDSEITLRTENWRGGDWDETKNGAHVMRRRGCAMQNKGITLKNFPWHSRPIFYSKPGQTINTPNVKERLFTDMSFWALGNFTTGLTQSSLSAVFNGNSRLSSVAVTTFRPPNQVLRGRAWELLINSPRRSLLRSRYSGRHAMLLPN